MDFLQSLRNEKLCYKVGAENKQKGATFGYKNSIGFWP